ncbi:MAG: prepilin-type N-terminal cleavage/methylation domain-containing protein [Aquificae bacterium]|nr:prepilin-type N-terminal cleavage/methylation domain-containing protein [Aquificota bacterium]
MFRIYHSKGFSLIELLIVISIILLLAAIALPSFIKYKKRAEISNIQKLLTTCARELAVEYTQNSAILKKVCYFPETPDNCTLVLTPSTGKILLEADKCIMNISGYDVQCVVTAAGAIKCYEVR